MEKTAKQLSKFYMTIIIIIVLILIVSGTYNLLIQNTTPIEPQQNDLPLLNFKKISNEEFVRLTKSLSPTEQEYAYKQHSAVVKGIMELSAKNVQESNNDPSVGIQKAKYTLIKDGWSDPAARDILKWTVGKATVILLRDPPQEWCKTSNCKPESDLEIKETLQETGTLSDEIIDAIMYETTLDRKAI